MTKKPELNSEEIFELAKKAGGWRRWNNSIPSPLTDNWEYYDYVGQLDTISIGLFRKSFCFYIRPWRDGVIVLGQLEIYHKRDGKPAYAGYKFPFKNNEEKCKEVVSFYKMVISSVERVEHTNLQNGIIHARRILEERK